MAHGYTPDFAKCEAAFTKAFTNAERGAGEGGCPTENDATAIEAVVDTCMADIASALTGITPPPSCPKFPATGQTTCWNTAGVVIPCAGTGQDGDIRAGAALSYRDNGDGTITDNNPGLMWEKKSADGSIHDKDASYTWDGIFAVHLAELNAGAGFAGHTDWPLPNVKELMSILDYGRISPAVSPAFDTGYGVVGPSCTVLTCSCTRFRCHSTSTAVGNFPILRWQVGFDVGFVFGSNGLGTVRAVSASSWGWG